MRKPTTREQKYYTVGVRFLHGGNVHQIYTYRIPTAKKVTLGQSLVADTERGECIVVVVRIDKTPQDNGPYVYQFIKSKVSPL